MPGELDTFKEAVKIIIEKEFPELLSPARHMMRAVVIAVKPNACDLQVLAADGSPHPSFPPLPNVPVPIGATVRVGDKVRVGFYYSDPALPYIDEVLDEVLKDA